MSYHIGGTYPTTDVDRDVLANVEARYANVGYQCASQDRLRIELKQSHPLYFLVEPNYGV